MSSSIIFQVQSALILFLLYFGVWKRKQRSLHVKVMTTAIIWDILLVLQIELTRGAIDKASKVVTNAALLNFHVSIAVTTVILYGFIFYFGRALLKGNQSVKTKHKVLGLTALVLRTLTLITSYIIETQ